MSDGKRTKLPYSLRRAVWSLRNPGPRCSAARCPYPQIPSASKWCREHTDAITAGGPLDKDGAIAFKLGARRWFLLAEVEVERERQHVQFLEGVLAQSDQEIARNRHCWTAHFAPKFEPSLDERLNELLALAGRPSTLGEKPLAPPVDASNR